MCKILEYSMTVNMFIIKKIITVSYCNNYEVVYNKLYFIIHILCSYIYIFIK